MKKIKTLAPGENGFMINDGIILSPRASIKIKLNCPGYIRDTIAHAFSEGWIEPIAHVPEVEYLIEELRK